MIGYFQWLQETHMRPRGAKLARKCLLLYEISVKGLVDDAQKTVWSMTTLKTQFLSCWCADSEWISHEMSLTGRPAPLASLGHRTFPRRSSETVTNTSFNSVRHWRRYKNRLPWNMTGILDSVCVCVSVNVSCVIAHLLWIWRVTQMPSLHPHVVCTQTFLAAGHSCVCDWCDITLSQALCVRMEQGEVRRCCTGTF